MTDQLDSAYRRLDASISRACTVSSSVGVAAADGRTVEIRRLLADRAVDLDDQVQLDTVVAVLDVLLDDRACCTPCQLRQMWWTVGAAARLASTGPVPGGSGGVS